MEFIDYYNVLGIYKKATEADVKKTYRKLARKLHPDLNPNDKNAQKNFQQINEANEVLSDPDKRKNTISTAKTGSMQINLKSSNRRSRSRTIHRDNHFPEMIVVIFQVFESMFGGAKQGRQTKYRGQDYNAELKLSLMDVIKTHQQTLTVNGKNIRITIPAGVENGQVIKLKEHGTPGVNGGPAGDLYITFSIANHPGFKRLGNDLYTTTNIDLYTALLGGETTIDTLNGKVKLKVAPETQYGTKIRLKGKGFPVYKKEGETGDLYVTYQVKLPTNLNEQQKALLNELSKLQ